MNSTLQVKRQCLVDILATTEDEKLIDLLKGFIKGYQDNSGKSPKVKVITTEEELKHTAAIAQIKIKEAAITLDGELFEIRRNVNKILFLLQELQEDYFYKLDVDKVEDKKEILHGYEKNSTYTEIIFDNAIEIKKVLNNIEKAISEDKTA